MDLELARVIGEDLNYMFTEWNQDISEASLRRSSPILRYLLVENKLHQIASDLGIDLRILAPDFHLTLNLETLKKYRYWQAGGARYNGTQIQLVGMLDGAMTDAEIANRAYEAGRAMKSYPAKAKVFLRQPSFVVQGVVINREEVIKYVVNKLGGAHYDGERKPSAGHDLSLDDKYILLDQVRAGKFMTGGKDAIYHELLSIGQSVVNSRDVLAIRKKLKGYISSPSVVGAQFENLQKK